MYKPTKAEAEKLKDGVKKLEAAIIEGQLSSFDIIDFEYLAIICESVGDKTIALKQILTGARGKEEASNRFRRLTGLHKAGFILERRNYDNTIAEYHYDEYLPVLLFQKFPYLFKNSYTPAPEPVLVIKLPAAAESVIESGELFSGRMTMPVSKYLLEGKKYQITIRKDQDGLALEITTVV